MNTLLREAFWLAAYPFHKIAETYDHAGFYAWRALMDDKFLAVNHAALSSPYARQGALLYGTIRDKAQNMLVEQLTNKGASGDLSPKPDIKPGLMRLARTVLPHLHNGWSKPLVLGATVAAFAVASHALSQSHGMGGLGQSFSDFLGTFYGSSPHTARPKAP